VIDCGGVALTDAFFYCISRWRCLIDVARRCSVIEAGSLRLTGLFIVFLCDRAVCAVVRKCSVIDCGGEHCFD